MSKFQKISKLFVVGVNDFRWNRDLQSFLKDFPVDGLALFNSPFDSPDNIWKDREASLEAFYEFVKEASKHIRFLSVDQEGGRVRRLRGAFLPLPAPQKAAEACEEDPQKRAHLRNLYSKAAEQMRISGVHLNFAPNCDMGTKQSSNVVGDRSFGETPQKVVDFAKIFIEAFSTQGIFTTLKHFPGHGPTEWDSHQKIAVLFKNEKELLAEDTKIFQELAPLASGVMTAHIALPDDPERIFSMDANLFKKFKALMPDNLAWFTDDMLSMKAVSERKPWREALQLPYDFLLICGKLEQAVAALEDSIRFAESKVKNFQDESLIDQKIKRSSSFFNSNLDLPPFAEWKKQILQLEQEGLAELERL